MPNSRAAWVPDIETMPPGPTANAAPHPRLLPSSAPPPLQRAAVIPTAAKQLNESALLTTLHELAASDPPLSLKLAREAADRFPDSPNAPEFEWNVVKALFNMSRLEEAKDEARIMLWKYPDNYYTGDVVHHLLNPPPNPMDLAAKGH